MISKFGVFSVYAEILSVMEQLQCYSSDSTKAWDPQQQTIGLPLLRSSIILTMRQLNCYKRSTENVYKPALLFTMCSSSFSKRRLTLFAIFAEKRLSARAGVSVFLDVVVTFSIVVTRAAGAWKLRYNVRKHHSQRNF